MLHIKIVNFHINNYLFFWKLVYFLLFYFLIQRLKFYAKSKSALPLQPHRVIIQVRSVNFEIKQFIVLWPMSYNYMILVDFYYLYDLVNTFIELSRNINLYTTFFKPYNQSLSNQLLKPCQRSWLLFRNSWP